MVDGSVVIKVLLDSLDAKRGIAGLKSTISKAAAASGDALKTSMKKAASVAGNAVKTGLKTGLKAAAASATATTAAVAGLGKTALDSYSKYEQMVGGVNKLFGTGSNDTVEKYAKSVGKSVSEVQSEYDKLNAASEKVQQYAADAWESSGMSANDYMENVTGISAALINSLDGDTTKAAEQANVAMKAISDNANTFGTDMNNIVMTYQSLARGNYAMLDNLKLGYGGTKTELQRLIKDANAYAKANKDVAEEVGYSNELQTDSFSDIVTAIELIQREQNIAGTTANEAATTIEGSCLAMSAAWENWVTELAKDDADMESLTESLVTSVVNAAANVIPRLGTILGTLGATLAAQLPNLGEMLQEQMDASGFDLSAAITSVTSGVSSILTGLQSLMQQVDWQGVVTSAMNGIQSVLGSVDWLGLLTGVADALSAAVSSVDWMGLLETVASSVGGLLGSIDWGGMTTSFLENIGNALASVDWAATLSSALEGILGAVTSIITSIGTFLTENAPTIAETLLNIVISLGATLLTALPSILTSVGTLINGVVDAMGELIVTAVNGIWSTLTEVGGNIINGIVEGITGAASAVGDAVTSAASSALDTVKSFLGIHSPSRVFKDEIGAYIPEGMASGIEDTSDEAATASAKSASKAVSAAKDALNVKMRGTAEIATAADGVASQSGFSIDYDKLGAAVGKHIGSIKAYVSASDIDGAMGRRRNYANRGLAQ